MCCELETVASAGSARRSANSSAPTTVAPLLAGRGLRTDRPDVCGAPQQGMSGVGAAVVVELRPVDVAIVDERLAVVAGQHGTRRVRSPTRWSRRTCG